MGRETNATSEAKESKDMKEKVIPNIIKNYRNLEKSIVNQLKLYNEFHSTTTGSSREEIWRELFETIIPKKFVIEHSVFIIDSKYHVSKEVDLAIIDNMYTPYIFHYGNVKFVPIEAVAAVIECKSQSVDLGDKKNEKSNNDEGEKKLKGLSAWCESIEALKTSNKSIVRMASGIVIGDEPSNRPLTQTSTRPIKIFCGFNTKKLNNEKGIEDIKKYFDFVLSANSECEEIGVYTSNMELSEWYSKLNHYERNYEGDESIIKWKMSESINCGKYEVKDNDKNVVSLLTLNFQLNQLLMLINNPMPFPHLDYAKMFDEYHKKE